MLPDVCSDGNVLKTLLIFRNLLEIIKIIIPIMLIILIIIDFYKASLSFEDGAIRKASNMAIKRIIAGIVVFILPSVIYGIFAAVGRDTTNVSSCLAYATSENVAKVFYDAALNAINQAETTLEYADYMTAKAEVLNVEDDDDREELNNKLQTVGSYVNLASSIDNVGGKDSYNSLKSSISNITDSNMRTRLDNRLEEAYSATDTHDPISPGSGETIVKQEETNTMKVTITRVGSYYITRVWLDNPYLQLRKFDSPEYGKNLYKPSVLLEKAMSTEGISNKLLVGFNASGFYLANTYDADSVAKYSAYNKTSVGTLVITEGKVVRNVPDKAYKTWFITGIDNTGKLRIFTDAKASSSEEIESKKDWATSVINGGLRNTFTFASPLIVDGVESSQSTSMPSPSSSLNRQAICQVDRNNFALITGSGLNRQNLVSIMLSLNCQTGTNLDGGGSIALVFKSKNSNKIETIVGNGRNLSEVGYFAEY